MNSENQNNERNQPDQGGSNNQGGDDGDNNKKKIKALFESLNRQESLDEKKKILKQQLEQMLNLDANVSAELKKLDIELQQLEMTIKSLRENISPEGYIAEICRLQKYAEHILEIKKENEAEMKRYIKETQEKSEKIFYLSLYGLFYCLKIIFGFR